MTSLRDKYPHEVLSEPMKLGELIKREKFPQILRVLNGYYGAQDCDTIGEGQIMVAYFVKRTKVMRARQYREVFSIPLHSSVQFGPVQEKGSPIKYEKVSDIFSGSLTPPIVCVNKMITDKGGHTIRPGTLLLPVEKQGLKNIFKGQKNAEFRTTMGSTVKIPLDATGHFSADPENVKLYIPEILQYFKLPLEVKCFGESGSCKYLSTFTFLEEGVDVSLIGGVLNEDQDQYDYKPSFDLPVSYPIDVVTIKLLDLTVEEDIYSEVKMAYHSLDKNANYSKIVGLGNKKFGQAQKELYSDVRSDMENEAITIDYPENLYEDPDNITPKSRLHTRQGTRGKIQNTGPPLPPKDGATPTAEGDKSKGEYVHIVPAKKSSSDPLIPAKYEDPKGPQLPGMVMGISTEVKPKKKAPPPPVRSSSSQYESINHKNMQPQDVVHYQPLFRPAAPEASSLHQAPQPPPPPMPKPTKLVPPPTPKPAPPSTPQVSQPALPSTPQVSQPAPPPITRETKPTSPSTPQVSQPAPTSTPQVSQPAPPYTPQVSQPAPPSTPQVSQQAPPSTPQVSQQAPPSTPQVSQRALPSTPQVSQRALPSTPQVSQSAPPSTPQVLQRALPSTPQVSQIIPPSTPQGLGPSVKQTLSLSMPSTPVQLKSKSITDENIDFLKTLDCVQIIDLLKAMNIPQYVECFKMEHIDGELLSSMDDSDLEELGLQSKLHRKRICKVIEGKYSTRSLLQGEDPYGTL